MDAETKAAEAANRQTRLKEEGERVQAGASASGDAALLPEATADAGRRRGNAKRRCAARRLRRLDRARSRKAFVERDQGVGPEMTQLNARKRSDSPPRRGAPPGNRNALKRGRRTGARKALFAAIRAHVEEGRR